MVFISKSKKSSKGKGKATNQYDTTVKEIFEDSSEAFIQFFAGENYELDSTMTIEFPKTESRRADEVFIVNGPEGKAVCHIEFQSYNDTNMPYRMLEYVLKVHQRKKLPINQLVIYFGGDKLNMEERIKYYIGPGRYLDFSYQIIDLGGMPFEKILKQGNPKLFALLPVTERNSYRKNSEEHLTKSTDAIMNSSLPLKEKRQVLFQASLLAGLVYQEELIEKVFAEVENMINIEESSTYRRIIRKGEERGQKIGLEQGQKKALTEMLIQQLTAKFGKLSPDYSERIKEQELETLQVLVVKIFELNKPEDLEEYLH
ncbi:DUF4351 domain-containing protein [Heliorestis convoluta]|uniref:DUF4351 domain-containing protein n=1 Tax=Heliorestis convoluta TaxID=356322 RepID=A0A5Q2N3J1_9FIRM|nr:DUF4351 domain-containing protein [Heliorestis convoluta]QGG48881.1 hypothetical protein FTV88_2792 [Heliorestis convoluta]